jgi:hypothetical protein
MKVRKYGTTIERTSKFNQIFKTKPLMHVHLCWTDRWTLDSRFAQLHICTASVQQFRAIILYKGQIAQNAVQCCADVHFFNPLRTGVSSEISDYSQRSLTSQSSISLFTSLIAEARLYIISSRIKTILGQVVEIYC